ncbi:unnamed protein product, partial [Mesorhabditis belari]|uniref:RNA/RNP complex-1-interacting phosphatase n=1 Tax=Mesorhabditis belari TaxID=2138241 RepID=A0AAF3E953_9BILA
MTRNQESAGIKKHAQEARRKNTMVRTSRVVPRGWTKYTEKGNVIPNTRFFVFKTPLNYQLLTKVPKKFHWTTLHLMRKLAETGQKLGLVIDLTDTTRYYDRKEFEGVCVQYEKIFCPGRGFVERDEVIEQFYSAIKRFTLANEDEELLIGVHCTHGVNRSGYLICRFLIERLGWSSHEAIDAFEKARGYPIEKGAYVQALHKAAKDARNKKIEKSGSEDSEVLKKRRKKEKRKQRDDGETNDMIQQFLGQLGQHTNSEQIGTSAMDSPADFDNSPAPQSWTDLVDLQRAQTAEDVTDSPMLDEFDDEQNGPEEMSNSKKRRLRKRKQEELLKVMKRGNFHEIQEMINARYGDG